MLWYSISYFPWDKVSNTKKIEKLNLSFFAVFLNKINLMNIFLMNLIIKVLIVIQFQKGQINFMFLLAKETGSIGHQCNMVKN